MNASKTSRASSSEKAAMKKFEAGIEAVSGRMLFPLSPRVADVNIKDIAHALGNKCRYTGHCREFYSVAQHSVLVSQVVDRRLALAGLLHDASEYVLPDVSSPVKPRLKGFKEIEEGVLDAVFKRFGILATRQDEEAMAEIKAADRAVMAIEVRDLMPGNPDYWDLPDADPFLDVREPWGPKESREKFMDRYEQIMEAMAGTYEVLGR